MSAITSESYRMPIIHREYKQLSAEWMMAHVGVPTASEFDALVTPKWEIKKGKGPASFLAKKVAEAWQDGPLPGFGSFAMEQGQILEKEAIPAYSGLFDVPIDRVGFVTTADGRVGCSPDGLIGLDGGIEIKCPEAPTHTAYLLADVLPDDYVHQVYGSMFVTGRQWWDFYSYRRGFPDFIIRVQRDEEIMATLEEALSEFLLKFDKAMKRMEEINGGPAPKKL